MRRARLHSVASIGRDVFGKGQLDCYLALFLLSLSVGGGGSRSPVFL